MGAHPAADSLPLGCTLGCTGMCTGTCTVMARLRASTRMHTGIAKARLRVSTGMHTGMHTHAGIHTGVHTHAGIHTGAHTPMGRLHTGTGMHMHTPLVKPHTGTAALLPAESSATVTISPAQSQLSTSPQKHPKGKNCSQAPAWLSRASARVSHPPLVAEALGPPALLSTGCAVAV